MNKALKVALSWVLSSNLATAGNPDAVTGDPTLVVVVPAAADCNCIYTVTFDVVALNNCAFWAADPEVIQTQGKCQIDGSAACETSSSCKGTRKIKVKILNWGVCCAGPMQLCMNGSGYSIIPHNDGAWHDVTVGGDPLPCNHRSNSEDSDAATDAVELRCGNAANTCTDPAAPILFSVVAKENCKGCPG